MGTENEGFNQRFKGRDLGKSRASSLASVSILPTVATKLKEVRILPTLIYSYLWVELGLF